jgi:hypothetical protein
VFLSRAKRALSNTNLVVICVIPLAGTPLERMAAGGFEDDRFSALRDVRGRVPRRGVCQRDRAGVDRSNGHTATRATTALAQGGVKEKEQWHEGKRSDLQASATRATAIRVIGAEPRESSARFGLYLIRDGSVPR